MSVHSTRGSPSKGTKVCGLCRKAPDKELLGHFFIDQKLSVHQYCMFFASGLAQNGEDEQGFDGFLVTDICKEIHRAKKLRCSVCKDTGASIGCCMSSCKRKYHYLCGKKCGALFQFFGSFKTYCQDHRPHQRLPVPSRFGLYNPLPVMCPICLCSVTPDTGENSLRTPCCKNTWFHRECVQNQALSSGMHYFRCSMCNNKDKFQNEMHVMGIFIPEKDAIWEEGDAYADLLFSYNRCDTTRCLCTKGRTFSTKHGRWRIRLCDGCGQFGTHVRCQRWKSIPQEWTCEICAGSTRDVTSDVDSATRDLEGSEAATSLQGQSDSECSSKSEGTAPKQRTMTEFLRNENDSTNTNVTSGAKKPWQNGGNLLRTAERNPVSSGIKFLSSCEDEITSSSSRYCKFRSIAQVIVIEDSDSESSSDERKLSKELDGTTCSQERNAVCEPLGVCKETVAHASAQTITHTNRRKRKRQSEAD